MRIARIIPVLVLAIAAGACTDKTAQEFTREDREAIQKADAEIVAALNAKDIDRIAALHADNVEMLPPNAPSTRGIDAVKSFYGTVVSQGGTLTMEAEEVNGSGPLAIERGSYTIEYAGNAAARDRGKYIRVLRNIAGTWRIEKAIWSSDLPRGAAN